jgi:arylsulfatase A-like enzyme/Tfp pilus assembly protein PilF
LARPFRYTFILVLVAAGTALAAVGGWRYARASAPVNGPILLVSIGTLRADHLPVYGYRKVETPAIDALSADGVVFERAYSHTPQTLPAHASLLSGRLPFETGVRDNAGFVVKDAERMLPEMLSDRGFVTGAVVSSYLLRKETGINQGFAFFDGGTVSSSPDEGKGPLQRDGAISERIAERWLESTRTTRAFLFLQLSEPHRPYAPPARFAEYPPYDGEIAYADEIVGRLVKYLKTHQLYDQSTIILVSDHGEGLGDHGEQEHGLFVYEEAVRVPLIVKQAAGEGAGRRVQDVVQHVDLVPTILDLAKAPLPGHLSGQSLKPLLDGTGGLQGRIVYSESLYGLYHFGWSGLTSVTDGRYRFVEAPNEELYDLQEDPAERENLAGDRADVKAGLRDALDRLLSGASVQPPGEVSSDDRERLEALGDAGAVALATTATDEGRQDPKDSSAILETYRAAVERDVARDWPKAIELLQTLLRDEPDWVDVWTRLAEVAERAGRHEQAIDAYGRVLALRPQDASGHLGAASALLHARRLDEAREQAELAAFQAPEGDGRLRSSAHELLASIALARRDAPAAQAEAELAQQAEPARPVAAYFEARLLLDQRRYDEALPLFEQASAELNRSHGRPIAELHVSAAETLVRLERPDEAEHEFLEELRSFPLNTRARAELAAHYQMIGRADEAAQTLEDLVRIVPTPDTYNLAARLWTTFGDHGRAAALRAESARVFAPPSRSAGRGSAHH